MPQKVNLFIIVMLITPILSAQTIQVENDEVEIEYIDTEEVSKTFHLNSSSKIKSDKIKKIKVKCKLKSDERYVLDINKFSLIDRANKIRYRPTDISYQPVMGYMAYIKLVKEDIKINDHFKGAMGVRYEPDDEDKFYDFNIKNYMNFEMPVNFGTSKKPILRQVYFQNHKFKKFKALLFFPLIIQTENSPDLELVYGNEMISEIEL